MGVWGQSPQLRSRAEPLVREAAGEVSQGTFGFWTLNESGKFAHSSKIWKCK